MANEGCPCGLNEDELDICNAACVLVNYGGRELARRKGLPFTRVELNSKPPIEAFDVVVCDELTLDSESTRYIVEKLRAMSISIVPPVT